VSNSLGPAYRYAPDLDEMSAVGCALVELLGGSVSVHHKAPGLEWAPGKRVKAVFPAYAEPEDEKESPAISLDFAETKYDASQFTPFPLEETRGPDALGHGWVLWQDAEWTAEIVLEIWCSDSEMRGRVVRLVRETLQDPCSDVVRYGRAFEVPRYFGGAAKASIAPVGGRFEDGEVEGLRRHRIAYMTCEVHLPVLRAAQVTGLEVRIQVETT